MADYSALLRKSISLARNITLSLHVDVTQIAWTGQRYDGKATYVTVPNIKALVERKQQYVTDIHGVQKLSKAYIAILQELAPIGVGTRTEPIDVRDLFILPGETVQSPIISLDGFFDGGTGVPYYSQVYLG